jgi:hypothetical protein
MEEIVIARPQVVAIPRIIAPVLNNTIRSALHGIAASLAALRLHSLQ